MLLHCFAGCAAADILAELKAQGLLGRIPAPDASANSVAHPATSLSRAATRIWTDARIISGTLAERYLLGRSIRTTSPEVRYHPNVPHGPKPLTQFRPALVAAIRDESGVVGIHRTFLDRRTGMLAKIPDPKCGLGPFGGGAVRIGGVAPRLGLAEGLETALSASILFDIPCWATLGTERFKHVRLPADVTDLVLFLDNDAGGRRAETLARDAFANLRSIEAERPRRAGYDWNDVLRRTAYDRRETRERVTL